MRYNDCPPSFLPQVCCLAHACTIDFAAGDVVQLRLEPFDDEGSNCTKTGWQSFAEFLMIMLIAS